MARRHSSWDDPRIAMMDLQYHDVRPEKGLYALLARGGAARRMLLERLSQDMRATMSPGPHATVSACRACRFLKDLEGQCIRSLVDILTSDSERRAYAAAGGVCLQHVPLLLAEVTDPPSRQFLRDVAASWLHGLAEDMEIFALKQEEGVAS